MAAMKHLTLLATLSICALAGSGVALAQVARPSDKAVKPLIENAIKTFEQFERALDPKLRKGTLRGKTTEVNVQNYLSDYEEDLERLKKRFKPDYSASGELGTVLTKGGDIDRFIDSQPPNLKGRSEWDVYEAALNQLAEAYGVTFPLADGAAPRRINDAEVEQAVDSLVKAAGSYRKAIGPAFSKEEKPALQAAQKAVDTLVDSAKALKSRIRSGKPASGEAGAVTASYAAVEAAVAGRTLPAPASEAWTTVSKAESKIAQTFAAP
jgi:hypothetical protein